MARQRPAFDKYRGAAFAHPYVTGAARNGGVADPVTRIAIGALRKESVEASIAHPDAVWLGSFTPDIEIIMFGFWAAYAPEERVTTSGGDRPRNITYVTRKLVLPPKFKKQIITFT